jgi:uncharacterized protein YjbJ (UPF0337 family)
VCEGIGAVLANWPARVHGARAIPPRSVTLSPPRAPPSDTALRPGDEIARNEFRSATFSFHFKQPISGDSHMDKNRLDGAAKEIKGATKEAIGKVTGNTGQQIAGAAEKHVGTAQRKVGEAIDKTK